MKNKKNKRIIPREPIWWMKFRNTLVTHSIFHFIDNHRDKKWLTNTRYKLLSFVFLTSRSFFSSHQSFCHCDSSALFHFFFPLCLVLPPFFLSSHYYHLDNFISSHSIALCFLTLSNITDRSRTRHCPFSLVTAWRDMWH